MTLDLNQAADMGPLRIYKIAGQRPYRCRSGFDAIALSEVIVMMDVRGQALLGPVLHRLQQRGLVAFELYQ